MMNTETLFEQYLEQTTLDYVECSSHSDGHKDVTGNSGGHADTHLDHDI